MLINSKANKRYYNIEIINDETQERLSLSVEPPKLKLLKALEKLDNEDVGIDELAEITAKLISKNKEKKKVSVDFVEEFLDLDEIMELLSGYFDWITNKKTDPN